MDKQPTSSEVVLKEYPKTTYWIEGRQVRAAGNLILTSERLVFLRQVGPLSEKEIETLTEISKTNDTSKLIQFGIKLHKSNFQIPASAITGAKMALLSFFPIRPYLQVFYRTESKKTKLVSFMFTVPMLKRLLMSEFPTLGWRNAINGAIKKRQKALARQKRRVTA